MYNALNKAISLSTGDVVGILHSDDVFYATDILRQYAATFKQTDADVVYANGLYITDNGQQMEAHLPAAGRADIPICRNNGQQMEAHLPAAGRADIPICRNNGQRKLGAGTRNSKLSLSLPAPMYRRYVGVTRN